MRIILPLLAALAISLPAFAQEAKPEKKPVPSGEQIADQQREVKRLLESIENTMQQVAKILKRANPDQAAKLTMAFRKSRHEDANLERLQEIENYLRSGYFEQALNSEKELTRALGRLMDILLDRESDRKQVEEEIKRLEDIQQTLNKIIVEERRQFHESEKHANPEEVLRRAAVAKQKLEQLIGRQQEVIDRTKDASGGETGKKLDDLKGRLKQLENEQKKARGQKDPGKQAELAKKAEDLAKDIAKFAAGMPKPGDQPGMPAKAGGNPGEQAAKAAGRASQSMGDAAAKMKGGQEFNPEQKSAEQDLKEAREALERLGGRANKAENEAIKKKQERIRKDTERLQKELDRLSKGAEGAPSGAGNLGKAQGEMKGAEKGLGEGERPKALPREEEAKKELERAYDKLEELEKKLKKLVKLPDYDKMADDQEKTENNTDDLLKKMRKEGGDPQEGEAGKGTPGEGQTGQAKKAMQRAKRNLRGKSAKSANSDQKEALDRLEKAREELEEALRQLREEQQLMLLDALERRLNTMLRKQIQISKETIALHLRVKSARKPARADVDKSNQLAIGERELEGEADKILEILKEEGTTVVIPDVVNDVKGDLATLDTRLLKLQTGRYTQQIQSDIIETLRQLIKVIQEERERRQGGGGGGGSPQEGDPDENLLPTSAELKMLKEMQVRVNRRTGLFQKMVEHNKDQAEGRADERARIAKKQSSVGNLTRSMADKLNKEEDE